MHVTPARCCWGCFSLISQILNRKITIEKNCDNVLNLTCLKESEFV